MSVESRYGVYRNFWRRFWAGMVDGLLFHPLTWIDRWVWHAGLPGPMLILWFVVANSVGIAYEVILHGLYGQTVGKKLVGIRVFDVSGGKLSMRQAVLRSCFPIVANGIAILVDLPKVADGVNPYDPETFRLASATVWQLMLIWSSLAWLVIELVTMFSNPRRRALHDFIAHSVVTRVTKEAAVTADVQRPRSAAEFTDREVTQARQDVRVCPRCGEAVLMSESRCPACGSIRHRFVGLGAYGIDQWIPIVAILMLVGLILLAMATR